MLLGILQPPSAGGGQLSLSIEPELSREDLSLPAGEEIEDDAVVGKHVAVTVGKDETIEGMEDRLVQMMREICQMETKVAEVARKLVR